MKKQKGVTLISLIIYMIVLMMVIGILSLISTNFYQNAEYIKDQSKYIAEYNKFNMYFIEDVKKNKTTISCTTNAVIFADGTRYEFKEGNIYRNKAKICSNIFSCNFKETSIVVSAVTKNIISVQIIIAGSDIFNNTTQYVLRYS